MIFFSVACSGFIIARNFSLNFRILACLLVYCEGFFPLIFELSQSSWVTAQRGFILQLDAYAFSIGVPSFSSFFRCLPCFFQKIFNCPYRFYLFCLSLLPPFFFFFFCYQNPDSLPLLSFSLAYFNTIFTLHPLTLLVGYPKQVPLGCRPLYLPSYFQ